MKMPEYDKELRKRGNSLDLIMDELPKYLVTFKEPVFALPEPVKQKICVYPGWWHSLDGWNYEDKQIERWERLNES